MNWFAAARPKTLIAAIAPIATATVLAFAEYGDFNLLVLIYTLLSMVFIQIGTNFFNDVLDFKKGADTAERLGPDRITQKGFASPASVFRVAIAFFILGALVAIPIIIQGGWPILLIGVFCMASGYFYTGGPYPIAYRGLGEIFVLLCFGVLTALGTYYLQTGFWSFSAFVLGLQEGCLAMVLIAVNNLRDVHQDKKANKKTLAVLYGEKFSKIEISLLWWWHLIPGVYWWQQGFELAAALPLLTFPLGVVVMFRVFTKPPGTYYNKILGLSVLSQLFFSLLISLGFWFS